MPTTAISALRWPGRGLLGALVRRPSAGADGAHAGRVPEGFAVALGEFPGATPDGLGSGARLCRHLDLYHDGEAAALTTPPGRPGLALSCARAFGGSYLSLVAAVPEPLAARFGPGRVMRLSLEAETSRPLAVFMRLNIGSADGHEVFHETLVVHRGHRAAEFDLAALRLPFDARLRAWADIIFSRPAGADIGVTDLRLSVIGKEVL